MLSERPAADGVRYESVQARTSIRFARVQILLRIFEASPHFASLAAANRLLLIPGGRQPLFEAKPHFAALAAANRLLLVPCRDSHFTVAATRKPRLTP